MCLHYAYSVIVVYDKSREVVTFTMYKAITVSGSASMAMKAA
jgi:hypothetical protein